MVHHKIVLGIILIGHWKKLDIIKSNCFLRYSLCSNPVFRPSKIQLGCISCVSHSSYKCVQGLYLVIVELNLRSSAVFMFACVVSLLWNVIVIVVLLFVPTAETFAFVAFTTVSFQLLSKKKCKRFSRFWRVVLLIVAWCDCGRVGISKRFIEFFRGSFWIHLLC